MDADEADEAEIENNREPSLQGLLFKYIKKIAVVVLIVAVVIYINYQISLASHDNHAFTSHFIYNIFAIVLPVIAILCFILLSTIDTDFGMYIIAGTIFAIALFGVGFFLLQTTLSQYIFNKYLLYTVIAFAIIIGFSIVATLLSGTLRKQIGWTGFFANLVFYIPCLIRDGIKGAIKEYNTLSTTLFILFAIEIVLLLMYFFLIPLFNTNVLPSNISLLGDPLRLNTAVPLSVAPIYTGTGPWNNFSISMWVYVNPAPNTKIGYTQQTPIFSYAPKSSDNYFTMNYLNDAKNGMLFNLDISNTNVINTLTGTTVNPIPFTMPLQKWNNVIFNVITQPVPTTTGNTTLGPSVPRYETSPNGNVVATTTTIDIFLNGELLKSCPLKSTPKFSATDMIQIGSGSIDANVNGLYGAICNIVYYKQPLSRLSLIYNYNTLVINNPPVQSI
jgi:hypothetical protein